MRVVLVVLLLGACAAPETQAEADRNWQRRVALASAMQGASEGFYRQSAYQPRNVTCYPVGGTVNCTNW